MSSGQPRYSFETKPTRQTEQAARAMLRILLARLDVDIGGDSDILDRIRDDQAETLLTYTRVCHLNIDWYDRQRKREQRWYWSFAAFTALLVVAMPVGILVAHYLESRALTAQVSVIIAGVLSAHRMLSTMLEKRNLVRHFWKAQAELKTLLYSFEDKWRGKALASKTAPPVFSAELMKDVRAQIRQARQVKQREQEEFFARYDSAFSNLAEVLGFVHKQSGDIAGTVRERHVRRLERVAQINAEVAELEAQREAIIRQIDELERELPDLDSSTTELDRARRAAVVGALQNLYRNRLDTEYKLTTARTQLEHIEHS